MEHDELERSFAAFREHGDVQCLGEVFDRCALQRLDLWLRAGATTDANLLLERERFA